MVSVPLSLFAGPEAQEDRPEPAEQEPVVDFFADVNLPVPQAEPEPAGAVAVENLAEASEATPAPPAVDILIVLPNGMIGHAMFSREIVLEAAPLVGAIEHPLSTPPQATIPSPEQVAISAEMAHQSRVADAEQEYMRASMRVNEIEDEIAAKKAELKEAKELWQALYVRLCAIQAGDLDDDDDEEDEVDPEAATDIDSESVATPQATGEPLDGNTSPIGPQAGEAWRQQPLRDIIAGTAGCGAKKLDAICEMLPTLGDFVDLQGKAGGMGIHTEMPKGVGRGLCDALEEKVLNWLSANRDKFGEPISAEPIVIDTAKFIADFDKACQEAGIPIKEQISTEAAAPEGTGASEDADDSSPTGSEEAASRPESPPQVFSGPAQPADDIHAAQIKARLEVLRARDPSENVMKPNDAIFDDGRHAAREDWPVTDCNWTAGPNQDSWLLGWLSIKKE